MCNSDLFLVIRSMGEGYTEVVGVYTGALELVERYVQAKLRNEDTGKLADIRVEPIRPVEVTAQLMVDVEYEYQQIVNARGQIADWNATLNTHREARAKFR